MCEATILKLEAWVADTLREDYENIREEVVKSSAVNADETSFRIGGTNGWLWVFTSGGWVHITRLLQPEVTKFRKKCSKSLKAFWAEMPGSHTMW
jgi:hypothetical protein